MPETATFKRSLKAVNGTAAGSPTRVSRLTADVTADATGVIQIGLTAAETVVSGAGSAGLLRQAVCQVTMTSGADVQTFQARVLSGYGRRDPHPDRHKRRCLSGNSITGTFRPRTDVASAPGEGVCGAFHQHLGAGGWSAFLGC